MDDLNDRLIAHLESRQIKEDDDHEPLKNGEFFAFNAGRCPRWGQWKAKNKIRAGGEVLKIMLTGKLIHDYVQRNVMGGYQHEVPLQHKVGPLTIRARLDSENEQEVAEIKSTGWMPKEPQQHHLAQIAIYMKERNKAGRLIYVERNKFVIKEHILTLPDIEAAYTDAMMKYQMIYDANEKGEIAPAMPLEWECKYCENPDCPERKTK